MKRRKRMVKVLFCVARRLETKGYKVTKEVERACWGCVPFVCRMVGGLLLLQRCVRTGRGGRDERKNDKKRALTKRAQKKGKIKSSKVPIGPNYSIYVRRYDAKKIINFFHLYLIVASALPTTVLSSSPYMHPTHMQTQCTQAHKLSTFSRPHTLTRGRAHLPVTRFTHLYICCVVNRTCENEISSIRVHVYTPSPHPLFLLLFYFSSNWSAPLSQAKATGMPNRLAQTPSANKAKP